MIGYIVWKKRMNSLDDGAWMSVGARQADDESETDMMVRADRMGAALRPAGPLFDIDKETP